MYCVYKHTNLVNGRVYIGITRQKPSRRWHGGWGYRDQPLFWNAIQKYGWDGFSHEILRKGLTETEAYEMEKCYIELYKATDREFGYNISGGGVDETRFTLEYRENLKKARRTRPPHSDETKMKISLARRGLKHAPRTEEHCKHLSESLTGRVFSDEHRKRISDSKKGVYAGCNNPKARPVLCVETGKVYSCLLEAALDAGTNNHNISAACRGRLKTSGGYHWEYV
jgi:group I intron endonuclease